MKKWIFCTKTTYLKILKAKDQLQWASQLNHDSPCSSSPRFNNSVNNWSMWGSSFKQIKLSQSLRKYRKLHIRVFVLLASDKSSSSNCLRAELFWSHCRQLSFSSSQRVKRKICVQKVISCTEQKLSQCTAGKQNYVIKSWENSDYYYSSNRKMIEVVFSSRVSLLALYFGESFTAHKWFFDWREG